MRVISGKFRGRRLEAPPGLDVRPTSDRLKESLFNILAPSIVDSVFLDLFAGAGAIGIEALSRGAREVCFVESAARAVRTIRRNLQSCGISAGFQLLEEDIFPCLRELGRRGFCADIVFMDPPYSWKPYADLLQLLFRTQVAGAETRVILEHHRKAKVPESGEAFHLVRTVSQGDKTLSFYQEKRLLLAQEE
jgi:16S rRNA (guanine(966)-N(2))-methyltransferase RsmD